MRAQFSADLEQQNGDRELYIKYLVIGAGRMAVGVISDLLICGQCEEIFVTDLLPAVLNDIETRFKDRRIKTIQVSADQKSEISAIMAKVNGALSAVPYDYNLTAMMRTTAFLPAIILEMLADGRINKHGVLQQEAAVPAGLFMQELEKRDIRYRVY